MTKCAIAKDGSLYEFTEINLDKSQIDYKEQVKLIKNSYSNQYQVNFNEVEVDSLTSKEILKEYTLNKNDINLKIIKDALHCILKTSIYFLMLAGYWGIYFVVVWFVPKSLGHALGYLFVALSGCLLWFSLNKITEIIFSIKEYINPTNKFKLIRCNTFNNSILINSDWLFYTKENFFAKHKSLIISLAISLPLITLYLFWSYL